jgi:hypothetical protein
MRLTVPLAVIIAFLAGSTPRSQSRATFCQPTGSVTRLPGLPEASGLAVSRRTPGRLWTHNDSGAPVLFALDARGTVAGRVQVSGARVEDWEAIAVGPCGPGSCIYVADIGDNEAERKGITIYRVPEPEGVSGPAKVDGVFHATYPDGRHDAEALLISGDGRLHIVTKGETGSVAIYRFPAQLQSGASMRLERVGAPASGTRDAASWITDGTVSPDGQWVVLRTRTALSYYRASDLLAGQWRVASRIDLAPLKEPQGEAVALGADNMVFLAGEGGGKRQPGTFARFPCAPS